MKSIRFTSYIVGIAMFLFALSAVFCPRDYLAHAQSGEINTCDDCANTANPVDINGDGSVNVSDLLIVIWDIQGIYEGGHETDVNGDGNTDMDDFHIVRQCMGCKLTPSPFT